MGLSCMQHERLCLDMQVVPDLSSVSISCSYRYTSSPSAVGDMANCSSASPPAVWMVWCWLSWGGVTPAARLRDVSVQ